MFSRLGRSFQSLPTTRLSSYLPALSVPRSFGHKMDVVPSLSTENMNQHILEAEYAVRGKIVIEAQSLEERLRKGDKLPFEEVIYCNIGNPQQLKQRPVTYLRQILSGAINPSLLPHLPSDVQHYCHELLAEIESTGAYSQSKGIRKVREDVAHFIARRDGHPADPEHIFLFDGASPAVKNVLNFLIRSPEDHIMLPIPQYPLYSASIAMFGGSQAPYYLDEAKGWGLNVEELQRAYSRVKGHVRALVLINPGNPTGQVLPRDNLEEILEWAAHHNICVLADEVYQENIYGDRPFVSCKKVVMENPKCKHLQLFSFNSTSKGFIGECGMRGGYMEIHGVAPPVLDQFLKLSSVSLCPNVAGQVALGAMGFNPATFVFVPTPVHAPKPTDPSHSIYVHEKKEILESLKRKANLLVHTLNTLTGVTCNRAEGAMYAFPQIALPPKAIEAAKAAGMAPDAFYCTKLLQQTGLTAGICTVPGSGFGQKEGTWHFRTTFLPSEQAIGKVNSLLKDFHERFMKEYA